jgi:hypothetical protein
MRFTNVVESYGISGSTTTDVGMFQENHSTGYHITAESGAANAGGLEITINRSGKYHFQFETNYSGTEIGLSLNSVQLATSILSITESTKLATVNGALVQCSVSGYFKKGDIIRPHANGTAASNNSRFACAYMS